MSISLSSRAKALVYIASILAVAGVGYFDYRVEYRVSLSIFYLLPIATAAWLVGKRPALALAGVGAFTWFLADYLSTDQLGHPLYPYWNALVMLCFFLISSLFVSATRASLDQEKTLARTDHLTGLANRISFYERAADELERARRFDRPLAIAFLDCDQFKAINDRFGHQAGDELLKAVADLMRLHLRHLDCPARLGGDEFIVLLPETGPDEAEAVIARLRVLLVAAMKDRGWPVTFSIGLASFERPPETVEEMVHRSDALMYQVKNQGMDAIKHVCY
jgi:diguanylate cyclase (GGDEF)-like protein